MEIHNKNYIYAKDYTIKLSTLMGVKVKLRDLINLYLLLYMIVECDI